MQIKIYRYYLIDDLIIEQRADKYRENPPTSNEITIIIPDEYPVIGY